MSKIKKLYPLAAMVLPLVALAQGEVDTRLINVKNTLNIVIGILFVLATIIFLWGVIQFIAKAGDEAARNKAKGIMTWGIIGLAVMAAAWGVVNILTGYFGVNTSAPPTFVSPPVAPQ